MVPPPRWHRCDPTWTDGWPGSSTRAWSSRFRPSPAPRPPGRSSGPSCEMWFPKNCNKLLEMADHYTIISADTHAGGSHAQYREDLDPEFLEDFDAWRGKYRNPYQDLKDPD